MSARVKCQKVTKNGALDGQQLTGPDSQVKAYFMTPLTSAGKSVEACSIVSRNEAANLIFIACSSAQPILRSLSLTTVFGAGMLESTAGPLLPFMGSSSLGKGVEGMLGDGEADSGVLI